MTFIALEDLKAWRKGRIAKGDCNYDDMEALNGFIDRCVKIDIVQCFECKHNTDHICRKTYAVVTDYGYCNLGEKSEN